MATRQIAIIGSLNVDFVSRTPRMPARGETLTANSFDTGFGGKGANQAVAAARLTPSETETGGAKDRVSGVTVRMVGNVGNDIFGKDYLQALKGEGIDTTGVKLLEDQKTGIANIIVEENSGENRILLATNANHAFSDEESDSWKLVPEEADVVVFQLEIPLPVVLHNMHVAREMGKHVVLNPAPAIMLPDFAYQDIDTLILNESEAAILAGPKAVELTEESDSDAYIQQHIAVAQQFLNFGVRQTVVITLGSKGAVWASSDAESREKMKDWDGDCGHEPAQKVKVVDTTAAGDTFVGAFAVQTAMYGGSDGSYVHAAVKFATAAAARTVERKGAMGSIPYAKELKQSGVAQ